MPLALSPAPVCWLSSSLFCFSSLLSLPLLAHPGRFGVLLETTYVKHLQSQQVVLLLIRTIGLPLLRVDPPGQPKIRCASQFPLSHAGRLTGPGLHQLWKCNCTQCYSISQQRSATAILHHLDWRLASTQTARRASPTASLVFGQVRRHHQRHHACVPGYRILLLLLAIVQAGWRSNCGSGLQLGHSGAGRCWCVFIRVLFCRRQGEVCRACELGQGGVRRIEC